MTATTLEVFAARLRQLRNASGLSRDAVAEKAGTNRTSLGTFEDATSSPNIVTLVELARLFDTTTDYLLGLTESPKCPAPGTYLVDMDYAERIRSGAEKRAWNDEVRPLQVLAVVVPPNAVVMTHRQFLDFRSSLSGRKQRPDSS